MSQDFTKVLVKDARLILTDSLDYGVYKGGQSVTSAQFQAISQSNSSHTYNIQIPSEQTVVDRRVMWTSTVTLTLTGTPAINDYLVNYGLSDALCPFPLNNLCSTMTSTINNNSVSINSRDVIPALLRVTDKRELFAYNGLTPTAFDTYRYYSDALNANNNSLGSFSNVSDNDLYPRGCFKLDSIVGNTIQTGTDVKTVVIKFTITEPLLLSPWMWADPQSNRQGLIGLQNLNFVMNIGDASRVWRSANPYLTAGNGAGVVVTKFENSALLFTLLTPHPSDIFSSRCVVPFMEFPRYITSNFPDVPAGNTVKMITSSLQLNQVPDRLIIMVRKQMQNQTYTDTDSCLAIQNISINYNNNSGLLSSATPQDLYRMSRENGSNQTWLEFSGEANLNDNSTGNGQTIATSGSFLILEFGKDIALTEDFYAPGSLVNANLQINLTVTNYGSLPLTTPEICLIVVNSGILVTQSGTSSTYTGILTKQEVLDASSQTPISHQDVKRYVGGSFLDSLKSAVSTGLKVAKAGAPLAKLALGYSSNPYAKIASNAIGAVSGMGRKTHKRLA